MSSKEKEEEKERSYKGERETENNMAEKPSRKWGRERGEIVETLEKADKGT